jgi:hypothetical protein
LNCIVFGLILPYFKPSVGGASLSNATDRIHRIVGAGVGCPDPRVLVCVGGNVGDELLRRQREEPCEPRARRRRRGQPSFSQVVVSRRRESGGPIHQNLAGRLFQSVCWGISEGVKEDGVKCCSAKLLNIFQASRNEGAGNDIRRVRKNTTCFDLPIKPVWY